MKYDRWMRLFKWEASRACNFVRTKNQLHIIVGILFPIYGDGKYNVIVILVRNNVFAWNQMYSCTSFVQF